MSEVGIFVSLTGNVNIFTVVHVKKLKNIALVGNTGHHDNEIDLDYLEGLERTQVDINNLRKIVRVLRTEGDQTQLIDSVWLRGRCKARALFESLSEVVLERFPESVLLFVSESLEEYTIILFYWETASRAVSGFNAVLSPTVDTCSCDSLSRLSRISHISYVKMDLGRLSWTSFSLVSGSHLSVSVSFEEYRMSVFFGRRVGCNAGFDSGIHWRQ